MNQKLSAMMFAAAAFVAMSIGTPVYAITAAPNPSDFLITEVPGQYTVYNNSTDWYIYAFAVSNPNAGATNALATTGFTNWKGFENQLDLGNGTPVPVFLYASADANLTDLDNPHLNSVTLTNYIAPGTSSSDFSFFPTSVASNFGMLLVNGSSGLGQVNDGSTSPGSATPLPSTWLMLLGGFVGLGFFAYRATKKSSAALATA